MRFFVAYAVQQRDTSVLRLHAAFMDSLSLAAVRSGSYDLGFVIFESEAYLALGDTVAALTAVRRYTDVNMPALSYLSVDGQDFADWQYLTLPRMVLLRGDLAMALGLADEARVWYTRFIELWRYADAELQPTVARVKASLAKLGTR